MAARSDQVPPGGRDAAGTAIHVGPIAARLTPSDPRTTIRPAAGGDAAFSRALFHEERAATFAPLGLPAAAIAKLLDQQFDAQSAGYARSYPDAEHFIIDRDGAPIGRLIVAMQSSASAQAGEARALVLVDIALDAAARGRGIGTDLIAALSCAAAALGATQVLLSVRSTNTRAQRLYHKLGFVPAAHDQGYLRMAKPLG